LKHRLILLVVLAALLSGCAAGQAYRKGQEAERVDDHDTAVAEFTKAVQEDPMRAEFKIALERSTQNAARAHISKAWAFEQQDQLDLALIEYRRALDLDATNRLAASRAMNLEKTIRDRIEASRPRPAIEKLRDEARAQAMPLLNPSSREPIKLNFNNASLKDILNFLGTQSGINITYDPAWRDKAYTVTLEGVTLEQALQQILSVNQSFYKVANPKTILVADDSAAMHQKYDEMVIRIFYVSHADVAELTQTLNTVMRISTMPVQPSMLANKTANTITVRATASVMDVIERVIRANDKPRAEVIVDVQILEVNKKRTKELGLNLSNYSLGLTFSPEVAPPNTPGPTPPTNPPPFNLNTITQGVSTADFYLSVPTAVVKFLEQDSRTKLIAKPQLRGAEGTKLTLNLGDQIPVLSTVFGAAAAGGFASVPQSSFNYKDVGVNIEMTPRVTYEGDIVLDGFSVESSALGPSISVAGQDVPSFSSRKVTTKLRLREGESTLLAGLLRDEQRKSLTGFPGVMRVPVLRSLFGQSTDEVTQSDIVMLLTPHIVRTHELTAEDLAPIYIGTQSSVGLGGPPPLIAPQPEAQPAAPQPPAFVPVPGGTATPPGGVPPTNPPVPPGVSPVPTLVTPLPTPPTTAAPAAPTPPPAGGATPPTGAATPPRDVTAVPPAAPGPTAAPTQAQIIITPPGTEFRIAGGPYTVPVSINNASRVSMVTLTVTYNPNVLRVRTAQDGTFMRQGGVSVTFTPRIDAVAGRVDIAVARTSDQTGASGAGLLAALLFDAIGPGGSIIQVSGIANTPEGQPIALTFSPVTVTVR
jgi:general secretion pathway protein D